MTERQIYLVAREHRKRPDSPDKWRTFDTLRNQLETIVPAGRINEATKKLASIMRL